MSGVTPKPSEPVTPEWLRVLRSSPNPTNGGLSDLRKSAEVVKAKLLNISRIVSSNLRDRCISNIKSGLTTPFILGKAGSGGEKTLELEKGVIKADMVLV